MRLEGDNAGEEWIRVFRVEIKIGDGRPLRYICYCAQVSDWHACVATLAADFLY